MPDADSPSYTVREIAAILVDQEGWAGSPEYQSHLDKRLRQVRHWTACDYLRPLGKKHSGTGVARRYGPDEVRKAALLRELTRFGLTVTQLGEEFGDDLIRRASQKEWKEAIEGEKQILFQVVFEAGGSADQTTHAMNLVPAEKSLLRMLDPNVMAAEKRKRDSRSTQGQTGDLPIPEFVSGLTISLTQLFATLRL
ncbi:MAG: hypothetical protein AB7G34_15075 [Hyphomicrobiales bacterium]